MKYNIKTDANGYITAASAEFDIGENQIGIEMPRDFDERKLPYYRVAGGKVIFDAEKYAAQQREQAEAERRQRLQQDAAKRLQAVQAQQAAKAAMTADDVIAISPLLPEWTMTVYRVGDVVTYNGVPYKCIQARDCTVHPDWNPVADPAGWANYHATSAEYALPWVQPTGAHDAYQPGEWMIWTDGAAYRCTMNNTVYPPDALPAAWRK